jgi:hypothetical protein
VRTAFAAVLMLGLTDVASAADPILVPSPDISAADDACASLAAHAKMDDPPEQLENLAAGCNAYADATLCQMTRQGLGDAIARHADWNYNAVLRAIACRTAQ